jgi:predicted DCC family thiol-disulfide oxidoreductase YuxK
MSDGDTNEGRGDRFTIYFDGDCPFCVREVSWLLKRSARSGGRLAGIDIAAPEFDPEAHGADREAFMARIHGRRQGGELIEGMQVFREAYAAVGLGWLTAPTGWPLLKPLFDLGYRIFARHRVRLGGLFGRACDTGACQLPDRPAISRR